MFVEFKAFGKAKEEEEVQDEKQELHVTHICGTLRFIYRAI